MGAGFRIHLRQSTDSCDWGGINAPSFYSAFGSKEALFSEVVELYDRTYGQMSSHLWSGALSPIEAIEATLRCTAKMQVDCDHPKGCLLVIGATNCASEHRHVQEFLAKKRTRIREGYEQAVRRGIAIGDLAQGVDVQALARMLCSFHFGLSTLACDGATHEELDGSVSNVMALWDMNVACLKA